MDLINRDDIDYEIEEFSLKDVINYNEILVLKIIREILEEDSSLCRCSLCIEDVFALSLNSLPPRYIQITSIHRYSSSRNFINEEDVRKKVLAAWDKIKANPSH